MYMLPPYLAAAGHPKEALRQIYGYRTALFDRQTVRTAQASKLFTCGQVGYTTKTSNEQFPLWIPIS
jgi:hypothetical protein